MRADSQEELRTLIRKSGSGDAWATAIMGAFLCGVMFPIAFGGAFTADWRASVNPEQTSNKTDLFVMGGIALVLFAVSVIWMIVKKPLKNKVEELAAGIDSETLALLPNDKLTSARIVYFLRKRLKRNEKEIIYLMAASKFENPVQAIQSLGKYEKSLLAIGKQYNAMVVKCKLDPRWRLLYVVMLFPLAALGYATTIPTLITNQWFIGSMGILLMISVYGGCLLPSIISERQAKDFKSEATKLFVDLPSDVIFLLGKVRIFATQVQLELQKRAKAGDDQAKQLYKQFINSSR